MTTFLLIRHGHTDVLGNKIAGRSAGVHLSEQGKREVADLARAVSAFKIGGIFSSPLERTMETAQAIASKVGRQVEVREGLIEIDYGEWTGMEIRSLAKDSLWTRYNRNRSTTRIPGGEWFTQVQVRVMDVLEELRLIYPEDILAIVTHGDVIRVAIAHYMGIHLDLITRLYIRPASVSGLAVTDFTPELLFMNCGPELRI